MSNTATVITTKAGEALIAQMQAENKVLVIDKFIFANVPNRPTFPDRDDIVPTEHVVHESTVNEQGSLTENSVIYSTTLASNVGPFSFNWSGLFCSEHNVLVAINFQPPVDKTVDAPGITGNTFVVSAEEKDDYTDAQGVNNFVCKIAQVFEDGSVSMLRKKDKVSHYVDSINNLHTTRDAIESRPNLTLVTESSVISLSSFIQKGLLTDQRAETQAAFDYAAGHNKKLIIDCVVWTLPINQHGRPVHIYCPPNVTVEWLAGCSINSLPTDLDHYEILTVAEENITLIRPLVIGDKKTHIGTGGEWGYGVSVMSGANNVLIDNPICKDMWGDGIYIGYSYQEPDKGYPKNVTIRNPDIDNARRNGISLCAGDNITVIDAVCRNVGGAWPQAGFDCEPEAPSGYPKFLKAVVDGLRINDCISGLVQYALNQNSSGSMSIDVEFDNVVITSCEQPIVQQALGVSTAKFYNKSITINYGDGGRTSLQIGNTTDTGCHFETDKLTIKQGCRSSRPIVIMDSTESAIFGNYKINSLVTDSDIFLSNNYPNMIGIANFEVLSNYPVKPYQWEPNAFNLDKTVKIMSEIPFNLRHWSIETDEILPQYVAAGVADGSSLVDLFITRPLNDTRDFVLTKGFSSVNKLYYRVGAGRQISYENVLLSSLEIKLKGTMYYIKSVGQIDYIYH